MNSSSRLESKDTQYSTVSLSHIDSLLYWCVFLPRMSEFNDIELAGLTEAELLELSEFIDPDVS